MALKSSPLQKMSLVLKLASGPPSHHTHWFASRGGGAVPRVPAGAQRRPWEAPPQRQLPSTLLPGDGGAAACEPLAPISRNTSSP